MHWHSPKSTVQAPLRQPQTSSRSWSLTLLSHKPGLPTGSENAMDEVRDRLEATTTTSCLSESCLLVITKKGSAFRSLSQSSTSSRRSSKTLLETCKYASAWQGLYLQGSCSPKASCLPRHCHCCKTSLVKAGRAGGCANLFKNWLVRKDGDQSGFFRHKPTWKIFKIQKKKTPNHKPD